MRGSVIDHVAILLFRLGLEFGVGANESPANFCFVREERLLIGPILETAAMVL